MRPIHPQPGHTEADLTALLASGQFSYVECFTITLVDGSVYRYTSSQRNVDVVPIGGGLRVTYLAGQVLISGLRFRIGVGVEVDEQTITMHYGESDQIRFVNIPTALKNGYLDGARITRDRFFTTRFGEPWIAGTPIFHGIVSTLDSVGRTEAQLKVKSDLVLLSADMPRKVFQPGCTNTWGDLGCAIDQSLWATTDLIDAGTPTATFLPWTGAAATHNLGKVHIENGVGVTLVRTVRLSEVGVGLHLVYPLDWVPAVGDQFVVFPGCDRSYARCQFFSNTGRYQGFPFVPVAETAA